MPAGLEARLGRIEKALQPAGPRGWSLRQVVLLSWGVAPEKVGEPEQLLRPGEEPLTELVVRTARAGRNCDQSGAAAPAGSIAGNST